MRWERHWNWMVHYFFSLSLFYNRVELGIRKFSYITQKSLISQSDFNIISLQIYYMYMQCFILAIYCFNFNWYHYTFIYIFQYIRDSVWCSLSVLKNQMSLAFQNMQQNEILNKQNFFVSEGFYSVLLRLITLT